MQLVQVSEVFGGRGHQWRSSLVAGSIAISFRDVGSKLSIESHSRAAVWPRFASKKKTPGRLRRPGVVLGFSARALEEALELSASHRML